MSLSEAERQQLKHYLLEKIGQNQPSVVKKTAEAFGVTPASVYKYLDALEAAGSIHKIKRGAYTLVSRSTQLRLSRSAGELESENAVYNRGILPCLRDLPENVQRIWDYLCEEMINNVIDHSGAEHLDVVITRDALRTSVRLTDDGVGIFTKIAAYFGLATPDEAVGELFKGKLTTDRQHHSGEGIFFSSRLADTFMIVSDGRIFTHNRFDGDNLQQVLSSASPDAGQAGGGTSVYMALANDSKKHAKDVFDLYADVDGGFTKTRIPLKYYFESAPVSRSQAKRLCSRLDSFRTVELDFSGLDWMGQGFADQVFRVFQAEHPEVRLIPTDMSEDVQKMYAHVTAAP